MFPGTEIIKIPALSGIFMILLQNGHGLSRVKARL